jgi:hypothetical protein
VFMGSSSRPVTVTHTEKPARDFHSADIGGQTTSDLSAKIRTGNGIRL